jgi:hypothetical protein
MNDYDSKFSPGKKIRIDQYIIELICYNRANYMKIELPTKFWDYPEWASFFKSQLRQCHKLLLKYESIDILNTVISKRIWTLHASWIEDAIQKENTQRLSNLSKIKQDDAPKVTDSVGRQNTKTNFNFLD